jgi:glycosyltransferase involved in cell wall biosynthesis
VSISRAQRATAPWLCWLGTVYNAVDLDQLRIGERSEREPYLVFLARVCHDKGQHVAIEVARERGMRLVLAGKIEPTEAGRRYFRDRIEPHIDGDRVVHITNVAGVEKADLLARATALLALLQWEEPFGLNLVEAMASGTPVVAFGRGAAPEVDRERGVGVHCRTEDEMVEGVRRIDDVIETAARW